MTEINRPSSGPGSLQSINRFQVPAKSSHPIVAASQGPTSQTPAQKDVSMKAPSEQFRNPAGASIVKAPSGTDVMRNTPTEIAGNLALQQQASREGRSYANAAWQKVQSSPYRSENAMNVSNGVYQTYNIEGGRVNPTGPVSYQAGPQNLNVVSTKPLPLFDVITPEGKVGEGKIINVSPVQNSSYSLPGWLQSGLQTGYTGLRGLGYAVGTPVIFAGKVIESIGNLPIEKEYVNVGGPEKSIVSFMNQKFEFTNPGNVVTQSKAIQNFGKYVEAGGRGWVEEPGKTALFFGVTAGISYALEPISLGISTLSQTKPMQAIGSFIPESIKANTGKAIVAGLVGAYGYITAKRIISSPTPYETAGEITSTEIAPGILGSATGHLAWQKSQGMIRSIGRTFVPLEKLTPPEVLSGEKNFPMAPQSTHLDLFKSGEYAITTEEGTYYPHATPSMFGKKFTAQAGSRPTEAAGLYVSGKGASIYFTRIGEQDIGLYPSSLLPEASTPTLVYVNPTDVKPLTGVVKSSYGKVYEGPSYQFFMNTAEKGVAYVPGVKTEVEGIIPVGTLFRQVDSSSYTNIKGVDVPINLYDVRTKISARQYFYPGEDLKVPSYYFPEGTYNIPASSYAAIAGTSQALSSGTSYKGVNIKSVIPSSSYGVLSSNIKGISYVPYVKPSIKVSYNIQSKVSFVPTSIVSGGGSGVSNIISPAVSPPYIPPITVPYVPPVIPPILPPKSSPPYVPPTLKLFFAQKKKKETRRRPFKYQASVVAVARGIRTKRIKKLLSGFEVRGIPTR